MGLISQNKHQQKSSSKPEKTKFSGITKMNFVQRSSYNVPNRAILFSRYILSKAQGKQSGRSMTTGAGYRITRVSNPMVSQDASASHCVLTNSIIPSSAFTSTVFLFRKKAYQSVIERDDSSEKPNVFYSTGQQPVVMQRANSKKEDGQIQGEVLQDRRIVSPPIHLTAMTQPPNVQARQFKPKLPKLPQTDAYFSHSALNKESHSVTVNDKFFVERIQSKIGQKLSESNQNHIYRTDKLGFTILHKSLDNKAKTIDIRQRNEQVPKSTSEEPVLNISTAKVGGIGVLRKSTQPSSAIDEIFDSSNITKFKSVEAIQKSSDTEALFKVVGNSGVPLRSVVSSGKFSSSVMGTKTKNGTKIDKRSTGATTPSFINKTMQVFRRHLDMPYVRIHNDVSAHIMAEKLGASAFTVGRNIFFAAGRLNLSTPSGIALLGHELTHVEQQNSANIDPMQRPKLEGEALANEQAILSLLSLRPQVSGDFERIPLQVGSAPANSIADIRSARNVSNANNSPIEMTHISLPQIQRSPANTPQVPLKAEEGTSMEPISTGQEPPASGMTAPAANIQSIAEEVYSIIERRLRSEKARRGYF